MADTGETGDNRPEGAPRPPPAAPRPSGGDQPGGRPPGGGAEYHHHEDDHEDDDYEDDRPGLADTLDAMLDAQGRDIAEAVTTLQTAYLQANAVILQALLNVTNRQIRHVQARARRAGRGGLAGAAAEVNEESI
jgi:hypothetical protein